MIIEYAWREDDRRPWTVTASGFMLLSDYQYLVREGHSCLTRGRVAIKGSIYGRDIRLNRPIERTAA